MGEQAFKGDYTKTGMGFYNQVQPLGALGIISETLLHWDGARSVSWDLMQYRVFASLPDNVASHLYDVVNSTTEFAAFFQYFARAGAQPERSQIPNRLERAT